MEEAGDRQSALHELATAAARDRMGVATAALGEKAARELMVKGAKLSLDQAIETPRPGCRDLREVTRARVVKVETYPSRGK